MYVRWERENMYNPTQARVDSLLQQKQMIEQQINALSQYQMPPININNNMTPNMPNGSFDFNGKWVSNKDEAKGVANNNLPLILFDKNEPVFYMKNLDGSFKTFKFTEVVEQPQTQVDDRIANLEAKFDALISQLSQSKVNTPPNQERASEQPRNKARGGNNNE